MGFELSNAKLSAFYSYDNVTNNYTISMYGKGGPIVTSDTFEGAKIKFEKALKLSFSVKNLLFFKGVKMATAKMYRGHQIANRQISYTQLV